MFILLLVLYLLIILAVIILKYLLTRRNYIQRMITVLQPCPFGKSNNEERSREGTRDSIGTVSYSLYGNYAKYSVNLFKSLDLIPDLLPGWQARVYVAADVPNDIYQTLLDKGAEVVVMKAVPKGHSAATWRFLPAAEDKPFVSLDADDILTEQDAEDIQRWVLSDRQYINLNRHQSFLPWAAGRWGSRDSAILNIKYILDNHCEEYFGYDEVLLKQYLNPNPNEIYTVSSLNLKYIFYIFVGVVLFLLFWSLYEAYKIDSACK